MKDLLNHYYNIDCIGIIKINDHVYRIKTNHVDYIFKITNQYIEEIYQYIDCMNLKCFVNIIKNKDQCYLTNYNDQYCYVMEYIEINKNQYYQEKEKLYYKLLLTMHLKSIKEEQVQTNNINNLIHQIESVIQQRMNYYNELMEKYEVMEERSPSGWMYVLNYYKIYETLNKAKEYLCLFKQKEIKTMRKSLIYANFDYHHISLKKQCLISLDHLMNDLFVYDLYDLFQKMPYMHMNLKCFKETYLNHMQLNEEEKLLIYCFIHLIPMISFKASEMNNIIQFSYLLEYIDSIHCIID